MERQITAIILIVVTVFGIFGCGNSSDHLVYVVGKGVDRNVTQDNGGENVSSGNNAAETANNGKEGGETSGGDNTYLTDNADTTVFAKETGAETKTGTITSEAITQSETVKGKIVVIVNINSKVFHFEGCYHIKRMSDENKLVLAFNSTEEAVAAGYTPCGTCAKEYIASK